MNTFGHIFRLTSFGESHGPAMGGVIDGMPAGIDIDLEAMQRFVDRRRAGAIGTTARHESDSVEVLSGLFEGRTLGTPIGFVVRNNDARSSDYDALRDVYRPSHADFTYEQKYGLRDHRGGGRASARETLARVVGGAFAIQALERLGVHVRALLHTVGTCTASEACQRLARGEAIPDELISADDLRQQIAQAQASGDTLGGTVLAIASGVPAGWGEPVAAKLHADLAAAMLSINAAKAFEMGIGTEFASSHGSEVIEAMAVTHDGKLAVTRNYGGGVQGGISSGADIFFRVTFKPVPTLMRPVNTVDRQRRTVTLQPNGRHDVAVLTRAIPIVEAMTAIVLLDHYLLSKTNLL